MEQNLSIPRIPELAQLDDADSIVKILDDQGVRRTIESLNWPEAFPYKPLATFAIAHDGSNIWVDFLVRCNYLRAENWEDQSPVSQDSCVEIFLQPRVDGEYWNFEFNCIGTINASHRRERKNPTRLSAAELAQVVRYPSCGTRPFCELEGVFTWNLLVKIPLSLMDVDASEGPVAMRGNLYKCAGACSAPHYLSWNPIDTPAPDFHRPEFFAPIILE